MARRRVKAHVVGSDHPVRRDRDRLSLRQCREHLPPGFEVEDDELEFVRDQLYALAEVMLDATLGRSLRPR